jgi:Zn-dependent M16 (insulinase) family peptidase
LIKGQASAYANSVHESGHTFAVMHSASQYGPVDQMSESLFGLTQVNRMQEIARLENFDDIVKKLSQIADHVLKKSSLRLVDLLYCYDHIDEYAWINSSCAFNGESNGLADGMKRLETFLERLPGTDIVRQQAIRHENAHRILKNDFQQGKHAIQSKTHFEMPFDIFYSGQCYSSVPYVHEDHAR